MTKVHRGMYGIALALALLGAGCAGSRVYQHPEIDLSYYERVGVVPFLASGDPAAAWVVTGAFTTELLITGAYEVAEPGDFTVMAARIIGGGDLLKGQSLRADQARVLGDSAKVQAIFEGSVRDYQMVRIGQGSYPLVSVDVRMVDTATGKLLWQGSVTRRGGPGFPIFGWGVTPTLSELAQEVCRELAGEVPR